MHAQNNFALIVWLLLLWDYCDDLLTDAILCDYGHRETMAALDDIEPRARTVRNRQRARSC